MIWHLIFLFTELIYKKNDYEKCSKSSGEKSRSDNKKAELSQRQGKLFETLRKLMRRVPLYVYYNQDKDEISAMMRLQLFMRYRL